MAHATLKVAPENLIFHFFDGALDGTEKLQNFYAVAAFRDHLLDAADLPLDLPEPFKLFPVRWVIGHDEPKDTIPPQGMSTLSEASDVKAFH